MIKDRTRVVRSCLSLSALKRSAGCARIRIGSESAKADPNPARKTRERVLTRFLYISGEVELDGNVNRQKEGIQNGDKRR